MPNDDEFDEALTLIVTIIQSIPLFIGTVLKTAGSIRYFGLSVVVMVFYLSFITMYETKEFMREVQPKYEPFGTRRFFDVFLYFGVFIYAYDATQSYHQVYAAIKQPTVRRIKKMGVRICLTLFVLYSSYTLAAYLSLGNTMQSKEFDIFPSRPPLPSSPNDVLMKVLKLVMIFSLIPSSIINTIPLRRQLISDLGLQKKPLTELLFAVLIVAVIGVFSYKYRQIINWVSLLGAIGANSLAVLLPTLCYYQAYKNDEKYKWSMRGIIAWASFTSFMSFGCVAATFCDMQEIEIHW